MTKKIQHLDVYNEKIDSESYSASSKFSPTVPSTTLPEVNWLDRWLSRQMLNAVGNPPVRILLWDGIETTAHCANPVAVVTFYDRAALFKIILDAELHWGDLYCDGRVKVEGDMVRFLEVVYNSISANGRGNLLRRMLRRMGYRRIVNSFDQARQNIHHHYDIGNEFYRRWLDRDTMQYSCAYFPQEDMTLEQAQQAKLHHVCRKLQLKPGDKVVEAGCGWGGLSHFMVKHYGVTVTAYNISNQQIDYARQRAEVDGLSDSLEYRLEDYRNIQGQYDVFVSVGMLEHVARQDYKGLGNIIKRCLKPEGRGLIHSIGRITAKPMNPWIERQVFPGAYPPTLSEMMQIFEPNGLAVQDVENLRLHYSSTIQAWAERFEQNKTRIREMVDDRFIKAWSLYLYGSIAAFNVGKLQLYQVVFNQRQSNKLPRSRQHLYQHEISKGAMIDYFNS